ncbi:cation:proton antiporter [Alkalilimnicola sp. S0819]|uniref:cation:proton antiporter n=1 Tax=Alkalilimnicola sp. S0819 TaxID=2613922 RepID=UPI00126169A3|nr:cation:proton antiporter [Alkalilimnicola sp. S0819]KAB7627209.1 sodium:proton exchanger [Alkalilimnicola sp. S0819]MPQ15922.1 sodium:proton exchanger [Alkalilimnicola sp. S0819]
MEHIYQEITLLLLISAVIGVIALRLRQPLIVAFILVGLFVGPSGLELVGATAEVHLLAQIGITILLFLVGLKLDLHLVRQLGPVALATGLGQLGFTILCGYGLALLLGLESMTALYVAVALTFSSTIIIVKLLSDKRELDALHGRIAMGFLIVQDIAVVVAMALISAPGTGESSLMPALLMVGRLLLTVAAILLLMRYVMPRLMGLLAHSPELTLVFAVAWGTAMASVGDMAGFGKEVGAFLAGFSLASTGHRDVVGSRLESLRDFLLLFFFIDLGTKLDLGLLGAEIPAALALSAFVLFGNPLVVMAIMGYMGYRKRTGFKAGLTVAQISEFSILFIALGVSMGHVPDTALGLVTLVGLITITLSTYMILYSDQLYVRLSRWMSPFERRHPYREMQVEQRRQTLQGADVVIIGMGRLGRRIARLLQQGGYQVVGVDFDPDALRRAEEYDIVVFPADAGDHEFIASLPARPDNFLVSTLPRCDTALSLLKGLRDAGNRAQLMMAAFNERDAERLGLAGVQRLLLPYTDAADHAASQIIEALGGTNRPA